MMPVPPELMSEYMAIMEAALKPFEGTPCTQHTQTSMQSAAHSAQMSFLYAHPHLVAASELKVYVDAMHRGGGYNAQIDCPICTVIEKLESDAKERETQRLMDDLSAQIEADIAASAKRYGHMLRCHRRLMRLHSKRLPPSTKRIWESFQPEQQYAILKDIDYMFRHSKEQP